MFAEIIERCARLSADGQGAHAQQLFSQFISRRPIQPQHSAAVDRPIRLGILVSGDPSNVLFTSSSLIFRGGYTESSHHTQGSDIRTDFVFLTTEPDGAFIGELGERFDVLFNAMADADGFHRELAFAVAIEKQTSLPVLNRPTATLGTARDNIAAGNLEGADWLVPACHRVEAETALDMRAAKALAYPLLVRPTGSHMGEGLEKVADDDDLARYVEKFAGRDLYLSQFVDCRFPDGYYRKYRCYVVDGRVFANQLIIHDHWKIHGGSRFDGMNRISWMKEEERGFLRNFGFAYHDIDGKTLEQFASTVWSFLGLDFFGIDFSISDSGKIVLFEANAAMRSFGPEWYRDFPYFKTVTQRLGGSFRAMVRNHVQAPTTVTGNVFG